MKSTALTGLVLAALLAGCGANPVQPTTAQRPVTAVATATAASSHASLMQSVLSVLAGTCFAPDAEFSELTVHTEDGAYGDFEGVVHTMHQEGHFTGHFDSVTKKVSKFDVTWKS